MFKETHPILGPRDIQRAIAFYTQRLKPEGEEAVPNDDTEKNPVR